MGFISIETAIAAEVNKSFSPAQIDPGETSTLTVQIFNNQAIPLTNSALTDNLPAGMTVANPPNASTTCADGTVNATAGGSSVEITGATIPAKSGGVDGNCQFSVQVTTTSQGNSTNTIPANALTNDLADSNPTPASATLQVRSISNLSLSKNFNPNTIFVGQSAILTVRITNNDDFIALTNVEVIDNLPTNVVTAGTASTNCANGNVSTTVDSVTLTGATIAPDTFCTVTIPVTATATGSYRNAIPRFTVSTAQGITNSRTASANLAVQDLSLTKVFNPTQVRPGDPATLTLTLENGAPIPYTGIGFTDNLPTGLEIASPPNASNTCGGTLSAAPGANAFTLNGGSLLAGGATNPTDCTISIDVLGNTEGDYTNTIPTGAITSDQGASNFAPTTATLQIDPATGINGNLTVEKRFLENIAVANTPTRLRLRVRNNGANPVTGITLTDILPTNLEIATPPNISVNATANRCGTGATVTATAGSDRVTLNNAAINQNRLCTFQVDVIGTQSGTYTNLIPAGVITSTEGESNPQSVQDSITIIDGVEISKLFFPDRISPGGRSTLTVTLNNYLPTPLTGVQVTDNLPQGARAVRVADANTASTTCGTGTVTAVTNGINLSLTNGIVPAAQGNVPGICTFQVEVTSDATSGNTDNIIPVGAISNDQGISNLVEARDRLRFSSLNLGVIKGFSPLTVSGGTTSTVTVTLSNPSATEYIGAAFTDNMPTGMQVASNPNPSTTCVDGVVVATPGSNQFTLGGGRVPANGSCTVTVETTSVVSGNLTNEIPINTVTTFQGATNDNAASATLTNLPGAGLGKQFSPSDIFINGTARLTITVLNSNVFPLTNVSVADDLPSGVTIATPANLTSSCGGSVTVNPARTQASLSSGTVAAESSCQFSLDVTASTTNTYLNEIPINALNTDEGATNAVTAQANLTVNAAQPAEVLLVKRITAINNNRTINPNDGTPLNQVIDDPGLQDEHINWPSNYLVGEVDAGTVKPGDTIEYTIYFLNAKTGDARNLRICDRLSPSQSIRFGAYGTVGQDVQLRLGPTTNPVLSLTAANDSSDRTQWILPGENVPATCNLQEPNTNGTLILDVTGAAGSGIPILEALPGSTGAGQPDNSYGFFRFMTIVE